MFCLTDVVLYVKLNSVINCNFRARTKLFFLILAKKICVFYVNKVVYLFKQCCALATIYTSLMNHCRIPRVVRAPCTCILASLNNYDVTTIPFIFITARTRIKSHLLRKFSREPIIIIMIIIL